MPASDLVCLPSETQLELWNETSSFAHQSMRCERFKSFSNFYLFYMLIKFETSPFTHQSMRCERFKSFSNYYLFYMLIKSVSATYNLLPSHSWVKYGYLALPICYALTKFIKSLRRGTMALGRGSMRSGVR